MYDNPEFKLRISGHTDSYGSDEFNLQLSKERARNIRNYIVDFAGVWPDRVAYEGYGSSRPIMQGDSEEAKAINRRVEFEIYRPGVATNQEIVPDSNE